MLGEKGEGFLAGSHSVDGYGNGGFRFGGMSHKGSIILTSQGVHAWPVQQPREMTAGTLGPILDAPRGSIELLLIGTGLNLVPIPPDLRERLKKIGIRCEVMATGAAARTYNILLGERRLVAAALLAVA